MARPAATSTTYLGDQTDPEILHRIIEEQGAPLVVIDDGSHIPAHVRESFRILFPLLPDGAIYCIEDIQTSYWPAWGGAARPARAAAPRWTSSRTSSTASTTRSSSSRATSRPTPTSGSGRVHCYHNLVVIEKGDNREGTNRDDVAHELLRRVRAARDSRGDLMTVLLATSADLPAGRARCAGARRGPGRARHRRPLGASGTTRPSTGRRPTWSRCARPGTTRRATPSSWPGRARSTSRGCSTAPTSSRGTTTSATSLDLDGAARPCRPRGSRAPPQLVGGRRRASGRRWSSRASAPAAPGLVVVGPRGPRLGSRASHATYVEVGRRGSCSRSSSRSAPTARSRSSSLDGVRCSPGRQGARRRRDAGARGVRRLRPRPVPLTRPRSATWRSPAYDATTGASAADSTTAAST